VDFDAVSDNVSVEEAGDSTSAPLMQSLSGFLTFTAPS
jgi:hypothetical protein